MEHQRFLIKLTVGEIIGPLSSQSLVEYIIEDNIDIFNLQVAVFQKDLKWEKLIKSPEIFALYKKIFNSKISPSQLSEPEQPQELPPRIETLHSQNNHPPKNLELPESFQKKNTKISLLEKNTDAISHESKGLFDQAAQLSVVGERRRHPRFKIELKVIIVVGSKSFRTKTKDLSLGGLKLAEKIPENLNDKIGDVYIFSLDQKFSIKFQALIQLDAKRDRVKFEAQSQESMLHLEKWINNFQELGIKKIA